MGGDTSAGKVSNSIQTAVDNWPTDEPRPV